MPPRTNNWGWEMVLNVDDLPTDSKEDEYRFLGNYKDAANRAIPNQWQSVKSVDEAMNFAKVNKWPVFGIQCGGQLFYGTDVVEATKYGKWIEKENPHELGEGWMNRVFINPAAIDSVKKKEEETKRKHQELEDNNKKSMDKRVSDKMKMEAASLKGIFSLYIYLYIYIFF